MRLTRTPIEETSYADSRIEWGSTRCYTVRTVETIGDLTLESDAPTPDCETLKDTFPPAAPKDLRLIATEGVISLIWEPNSEKDVAGYLVLRGTSADVLAVDHADADHRDDVHRRGGRRDAVLVRRAGGRSRGQHQPAVESRRGIGALIE